MSIWQSRVVFILSLSALAASIAWLLWDPSFEPLIGIILGLAGLASTFWPWRTRLSHRDKVQAREKWRKEFEEKIRERRHDRLSLDVIVHDVDRVDNYPDAREGKGISPWFKVGLMGTYHRGILLGFRWANIVQKSDGNWTETLSGSKETGGVKVVLLGKVPYECVEHVNWDGDEYYGQPHLYLHFDFSGEPYEEVVYAEQRQLDPSFAPYYVDIAPGRPRHPWWRIF